MRTTIREVPMKVIPADVRTRHGTVIVHTVRTDPSHEFGDLIYEGRVLVSSPGDAQKNDPRESKVST